MASEENEAHIRELLKAFEAEIRRQLELGPGEVHAVAHIEGKRLTERCRVQPAFLRPLTKRRE